MSRFVFDTTKPQPIELQQFNQTQIEPDQAQPNIQVPAIQPRKVVVVTLKRSVEIGPLLRRLAPKVWNRTARLLFQKLGKSIDNKNINLVSQEVQLQAFKVHVNEAKVKKRRKVERVDLNKKFATVADIIRIRKDMEPIIVVNSG